MADVFLSYKSDDRPRVRPLADALAADGLTLWWDAHIAAGGEWRQEIQDQLAAARCVIVVWSSHSTGAAGKFVRDEATRADRRGVYLPVCIDAVEPPLGFGETQAFALLGWRGDRSDPRYQALLAAARAVAAGEPRPAAPAFVPPAPRPSRRAALVGGGVAAAALAGGGGWFLLRSGPAAAAGDSIAVLPFANLSGDPAQKYFSDGIAEELRSALSNIAQLKVAARTSSEKMRDADAKEAASKLGVANVLTGSVRRSPATIRVSAQLVDGISGLERWSQSFDRAAGDVLAVQSDIAASVAGALRIRFGHAERAALAEGGTRVPAAQDALLRSRAFMGGNLPDQRRKLALLDTALAADPNYATAWAARAVTLSNISNQTSGAERAAALAGLQTAAARAAALAPGLAYVQSTLGIARATALDFKGAEVAYRRALALGGDARALVNVASFLGPTGRGAEAVAVMQRATALDPLNPTVLNNSVFILALARRYAEAIAAARRVIAMGVADDNLWENLGDVLLLAGQPRDALTQFRLIEDEERRAASEAIAAANLPDRAAADRALAALSKFSEDALGTDLAQVHAQRREPDRAMAVLERLERQRDSRLVDLPGNPFYDPIRGDPRFKALIARLNFP